MLGVCLGHQSLVEAFGGKVIVGDPIHGKDAEVEHDGKTIYEGLPSPLRRRPLPLADRRRPSCPTCWSRPPPTATSSWGSATRELPAEGVQFHPESVLTPQGKQLLDNFLERLSLMPNDILTRAIDELASGSHLTADHTSAALPEIMEGRGSEVQIAGFLIALRAKGETVRRARPGWRGRCAGWRRR